MYCSNDKQQVIQRITHIINETYISNNETNPFANLIPTGRLIDSLTQTKPLSEEKFKLLKERVENYLLVKEQFLSRSC